MTDTGLRPARSGTSLELLARWLHGDDGEVADRVALATRTPDGWSELTYRKLGRPAGRPVRAGLQPHLGRGGGVCGLPPDGGVRPPRRPPHHQRGDGLGRRRRDGGCVLRLHHRLVSEPLEKTGLTPAEIDWVVPQNTDRKAWLILSRLLGIDADRISCDSLPDVARVISGDNVVNLGYLHDSGAVEPGDRLLLTMAGYGMNWQGVVLEKTTLDQT